MTGSHPPMSVSGDSTPAPWTRKERWLLAAILLAAGAVYLSTLTVNGLWMDELTTARIAQAPLGQMLRQRAKAGHLPVYFGGMWAWVSLVGNSEAALRLPSVAFGLGTLAVVFALVRRSHGARAAAVAALLVAANPIHLYTVQLARKYSLVGFLSALLVWAVVRGEAEATPRWRWAVLLAVGLPLLLGASYSAVLVAVPLILYLLLRRQPAWRLWAGAGAGLLLSVPAYWFQIAHADASGGLSRISEELPHLPPFSWNDLLGLPGQLAAGLVLAQNLPAPWLSSAVAAVTLAGFYVAGRAARPWLFLWAGGLVGAALLGMAGGPNLVRVRYFAAEAIAQTVLIAGLWSSSGPWLGRPFAVVALALSIAACAYQFDHPEHSSLREVVLEARESCAGGERLIVAGHWDLVTATRYYGGEDLKIFGMLPLFHEYQLALNKPKNEARRAEMRTYRADKDARGLWLLFDADLARRMGWKDFGTGDLPDVAGPNPRFPRAALVCTMVDDRFELWHFTPEE